MRLSLHKLILIICLFAGTVSACIAAEDFYQFQSPKDQQRFETLTTELRCLVCQNQNLAESNAGLAIDLRNQIFQQIQSGQSNQQIIDYLVNRYGSFILYRPPFHFQTLGLWLAPSLILLSGLVYLLYYIRRQHRELKNV
jgi:cytochrome c-type biogenesis protein CcmH